MKTAFPSKTCIDIPETQAALSALLDSPEKRNAFDTVAKCNELVDIAEQYIEHADLPPHYDWLVAQRNRLAAIR